MTNFVQNIGTIFFDPENMTKKHEKQASWKRVAMVMFEGDITDYYAWFIKKRYSIVLNRPLRKAHVTFINDREGDTNGKWEEVKKIWDGKTVEVELDPDVRTNADFWWLNVQPNNILDGIRDSLGLKEPYFSYHLTVGYPNEKNIDQSRYIHDLIKKKFIS